jgi:hypothetical protein
MKDFKDRIKLTPEQRKEVERYLGGFSINTEYGFLMLVRKMKEIERRLEELKYNG